MKAYVVDAFTRDGIGGNPAGVVIGEKLSDSQMKDVAAALGFSETAFVQPLGSKRHRVRFFTPGRDEVKLCGHATIASYHLLKEQGLVGPGEYRMDTKAGEQEINISKVGLIQMTQNRPEFGSSISPEIVAPCLGLTVDDFIPGLPIQLASTGLHKIFVPVRSLERLQAIVPNHSEIESVSRANGAIGMYCYSLQSLHGATAHCRNFAPVVGIMEDSATGTSAAALSCVLHRFDRLSGDSPFELCYEQGDCIGQPAELRVRLEIKDESIVRVQVAGRAVVREVREIVC